MNNKELRNTPYPRNLFCALFGDEFASESYTITADMVLGLDYALSTLTEQQQSVLKCRFTQNKSLQSIANAMELSRERIRQIEVKALRCLRYPSRSCFIRNGLVANFQLLLEKEYMEGYEDGSIHTRNKLTNEYPDDSKLSMPIEELDLSIRSFNCLKRVGINTIADCIHYENPREIYKLGKISRLEVADALSKFGIRNTEWD